MIVDFKDARIGDYFYWIDKFNPEHTIIAKITKIENHDLIYARVIQEYHNYMNRDGKELIFSASECQFYSCIEDINKIMVFQ